MIKFLGVVLLLSIWHSILFFSKKLGVSVILFILPLFILIIFMLKKEKKINNKYGLLLGIPIILLSCIYFIYDNWFFRSLNVIMIPLLFFLMYILTLKPIYRIFNFIQDIFSFIVEPFAHVFSVIDIIGQFFSKKVKMSQSLKKRLKSFIIILPLVLVVLWLLISADMVFEQMFGILFDGIEILLNGCLEKNFFVRIIRIIIVFFVISAMVYFLIYDYSIEVREDNNKVKNKIEVESIKMLFIVLNIIYVIFDFIQIKSLMLHSISESIRYAEYARQGFFQLMIVSVINLSIILISKKYIIDTNSKQSRFLKIMSLVMVGLTFVIIVSSFLRMNLYEQQYGYTLLRLLVYITLITEAILIIPTIVYIVKPKYNVIVGYMVIILGVYVGINYINVDKLIALRNVDRYYDKNDIDLDYLMNGNTDNLGVLVEFYEEVDDEEIKENLEEYFSELEIEMEGFQEYNFSKDRGINYLRKY